MKHVWLAVVLVGCSTQPEFSGSSEPDDGIAADDDTDEGDDASQTDDPSDPKDEGQQIDERQGDEDEELDDGPDAGTAAEDRMGSEQQGSRSEEPSSADEADDSRNAREPEDDENDSDDVGNRDGGSDESPEELTVDQGPEQDDAVDDQASQDAMRECSPAPADGCPRANDNCNGTPNEGCDCIAKATRNCAAAGELGNCALGVQTCSDAGEWGECSIQAESEDSCSIPGDDADCDGTPNSGCECTAGDTAACGPDTELGICQKGTATCVDGSWSDCVGAVYPAMRNCTVSSDNDCDGLPDNTLDSTCQCTPGTSQDCDEHPGLDGVGICVAGQQSCSASSDASSTAWGSCQGAVGPAAADQCNVPNDDSDCNGVPNEGCKVSCAGDYDIDDANAYTQFVALGCTETTGDLRIADLSLSDFSALVIEKVGGALTIQNTSATSLDGFDGLTFVGGSVHITMNDNLQTLAALSNLSTVGDQVEVRVNQALQNLSGLEGLDTVPGLLWIRENDALISLSGLESIASVGQIIVAANPELPSLTGLNGLQSVADFATVVANPKLTSLAALANLRTIGGKLQIDNNTLLPNLGGLQGITSVYELQVTGNQWLSTLSHLSGWSSSVVTLDINIQSNPNLSQCDVDALALQLNVACALCMNNRSC